MKKILLMAATLAMASTAHAGAFGNAVPFKNLSTANTTTYSAAYNVRGFTRKTASVDMTTGSATGTLLVQCGPTASGPWQTCAQQDATAISGTASYVLSWDDASAYVRASWARTAGKVSAYLNWNEN